MEKIATTIYRNKPDKPLTSARIRAFRKTIHDYYHVNGRDLPWRKTRNPYCILLSEIMLQQTQVERVLKKYEEFLAAFPDFSTLARAPLRKLLRIWQGMGYNRRALALRALAQRVVNEHRSKLPPEHGKLLALPGIGEYTAGAVLAFVFNKPVVFMDTNIRRVFIHEFYHDRESVHDEEIIPLVERTLDTGNPRQWYNALMDYGTMLKKERVNPNRKSAHYARQSPFENSNRQVRGRILKILVAESPLTAAKVVEVTGMDAKRVQKNLVDLQREGFVRKKGGTYFI